MSAHLTHGQVIGAMVANRPTSPAPLARVGDWARTCAVEEVFGIEAEHDALFSAVSLKRPDPATVEKEAVPTLARNLEKLLLCTRRPVKLVSSTSGPRTECARVSGTTGPCSMRATFPVTRS
ncbi:hypothetical protein [Streptomyces asiaticus]|uniref:hypothetical protein n=1 Tax=Streptomyces asiaticus TaxID=114695 RepID=UPI003D72F6CD